jgi:hypothetical protein
VRFLGLGHTLIVVVIDDSAFNIVEIEHNKDSNSNGNNMMLFVYDVVFVSIVCVVFGDNVIELLCVVFMEDLHGREMMMIDEDVCDIDN